MTPGSAGQSLAIVDRFSRQKMINANTHKTRETEDMREIGRGRERERDARELEMKMDNKLVD